MAPKKQVYQFKVTLNGIMPPIWRRIQVPTTYTFYDLHVAIQDAMGWSDSHPHKFRIITKTDKILVFVAPQEETDDFHGEDITLPDWEHKISEYEAILPKTFTYDYDFGDWMHKIDFEKVIPAEAGVTYPRCIKGKRACPPENCGGTWRYPDILAILADPRHEEYEETKEWIEAQTRGPFAPEHFDPSEVVFSDPRKRYKECFDESGSSQQ